MQSRIPLCNISYFMVSFGNVEVKKKKKQRSEKCDPAVGGSSWSCFTPVVLNFYLPYISFCGGNVKPK